MYLSKVIFSVDNVSSLHTMATFTRFLDTKRATGNLSPLYDGSGQLR